ncbi:hypothetical protein AVEN_224249-1 [Araneus ventricosus]|uniref:Uncharacterized protein n=1 Tax=Araneus ventricosus TaxID=182803 RepID=A0A4Y2NIQ0_ARAVE|nr:hypothetical protein AVEN_224249-1 [Araneus ventricosus]
MDLFAKEYVSPMRGEKMDLSERHGLDDGFIWCCRNVLNVHYVKRSMRKDFRWERGSKSLQTEFASVRKRMTESATNSSVSGLVILFRVNYVSRLSAKKFGFAKSVLEIPPGPLRDGMFLVFFLKGITNFQTVPSVALTFRSSFVKAPVSIF